MLGVGAAALIFSQKTKIENMIFDIITRQRIAALHPIIQDKVKAFLAELYRMGKVIRLTSGYRSPQEQAALYNQGRTAPGKIVTYAKPGTSYHNYGLAFDIVEIKNGKALYENPDWEHIAAIGKKYGFKWGGDFKNVMDKPHFEYTNLGTAAQLLARVTSKKVDRDGYVLTA